jgi:acetylxylan esterase
MTGFSSYTAKRNFIIIAPGTSKDSHCWDNHSPKSLKHEGGGDSQSIANMVKYTIEKYKADPKKVFVTGFSSGGMMTNTMAATYPDLFAAGISNSGVPAGCLAGRGTSAPGSKDERCAQGQLEKTGPQYIETVKAMFQGYAGSYPRMQIWHGAKDPLVKAVNYNHQLLQWSALHNLSGSKNSTGSVAGYTHTVYGDGSLVEGYISTSGSHMPMYSGHTELMLKFLGI